MTSILFDVNMYHNFFSIPKLENYFISDHLVHKGLKNRNFSLVIGMLVDFIMYLVLLRTRTHDFPMFTNPCITFVFTSLLNVSFWVLKNIF